MRLQTVEKKTLGGPASDAAKLGIPFISVSKSVFQIPNFTVEHCKLTDDCGAVIAKTEDGQFLVHFSQPAEPKHFIFTKCLTKTTSYMCSAVKEAIEDGLQLIRYKLGEPIVEGEMKWYPLSPLTEDNA